MNARKKLPLRCAIYTRKSTEEGLEQEFLIIPLFVVGSFCIRPVTRRPTGFATSTGDTDGRSIVLQDFDSRRSAGCSADSRA